MLPVTDGLVPLYGSILSWNIRRDMITLADVLSWVTTQMDPDMVKSILSGVAMGSAHWPEVNNPTIIEGDHHLEQEVCVAAGFALVQMHVTDWTEAQREDLTLSTVLDWLKAHKKTDLKAPLAEHTSSEESQLILQNWQNLTINQGALYLCLMPKGETEDLLLFIVPKPIVSPPWMDAIGMQVIRVMIVHCPCYGSIFSGWEWLIRCSNPSSPACIACNMRAIYQKCLYTQLWPLLLWTSCM